MLRKMLRPIGIILILTAIVLMQIPTPKTVAASTDFRLNGDILALYTGTSEDVSVSGTVKTIGEEAFAGNPYIREVTIQEGVKHINPKAFEGCSALEKVVIPNSVESIGNAAFSSCPNLREVSIGSGLLEFGTAVFADSDSLETIQISSPKFSFADGVLYDDKKETIYEMLPGRKANLYDMPDSVKIISAYAFYGCDNLYTLNVSGNVKDISAYAFANCENLQVVEFPYSVNRIQMKAFENCVSLEALSIPLSVQFIHSRAFDGCNQLKILAEPESYADRYFKDLQKDHVTLAEYEDIVNRVLGSIKDNEVVEDDNIDETNPDGEDSSENTEPEDDIVPAPEPEAEDYWGSSALVGRRAVVFIDNTVQTVYEGSEYVPPVENIPGDEQGDIAENTSPEIENLFVKEDGKGFAFPKYTISGNRIAAQAFYLNPFKTYEIPEGIEAIGEFSFARSNLEELVLPQGITDIGYGAFYHCDYLKNVSIPSSVTNIEPYAFKDTKWLNTFLNYGPDEFLIVGDGILLAYRGSRQNVRIPEGVKQIAPQAFMDHKEITAVELGAEVTSIGEEAFAGCSALTTVKGGSALQTIHDRAFYGCPLNNIRIPQNVTSVGLQAYSTANSPGEAIVIFQGTNLPKVGSDIEASRFSNEMLRDDAIMNADIAVISNATNQQVSGTVLDPTMHGFHGIVLSIREEAKTDTPGLADIVLCTLEPDASGRIVIPGNYTVYGREYKLSEVRADAFRYYENPEWLTSTVKEIELPGALASNPERYLGSLSFPIEGAVRSREIVVNCTSNSLKNEDVINARIAGTKQRYYLDIVESDIVASELRDAFMRLYPDTEFSNLIGLDIALRDSGNVEIHKLGQNGLTITIPVPISTNYDRIHIMAMDKDGQLESIEHELVDIEEQRCIRFTIYHCSKYGIYEYKQDDTVTGSGNLDESPDTGDRFRPKLVLEIGLLVLGLGLVLAGFWKKQNKAVSI